MSPAFVGACENLIIGCFQTFKRKGQLYVKHTFLQAEPASQEPAPLCLLVLW